MRFILILILLACQTVFSQQVNFFQGTWSEAVALAEKENKYLFIDAFTDWCGPCKMLDKNFYNGNSTVADFINANYIGYKSDCERGMGIELAQKFKIRAFPTILFFNPQGQLVLVDKGYMPDPIDQLQSYKDALLIKEEKVFAYDSKILDPGFPDIYKRSFYNADVDDKKTFKRYDKDSIAAYLRAQHDLFTEINWAVMSIFPIDSAHTQFFIDNYDKYQQLYKSEAVEKMSGVINSRLSAAANNNSQKELKEVVSLIEKYFPEEKTERIENSRIYFYKLTRQWPQYAEAVQKKIDRGGKDATDFFANDAGWAIYENSSDPELISTAISWVKPYASEDGMYMLLDTYAALLYKSGDIAAAEKWAVIAVEAGKKTGEDVNSTEELLKKIRENKR
ncbi:MAG: thioredoxin family protein [Chitinophagales bacterium]